MIQTQIELTEEQVTALERLAKRRRTSLPNLILEGVDSLLRSAPIPNDAEMRQRALSVAGCFRSGLGDLSKRHDDYLVEALDR